MPFDDGPHVFTAAITQLERVPVEDFSELAILWKVLVHYGKVPSSNVSTDMSTVWGAEPAYLSTCSAALLVRVAFPSWCVN